MASATRKNAFESTWLISDFLPNAFLVFLPCNRFWIINDLSSPNSDGRIPSLFQTLKFFGGADL